jgi:hypothetical protein
VHENTTIEQYQTMLKEELTGHLHNICDLETKVQELEGKAEEPRLERTDCRIGSRSWRRKTRHYDVKIAS